MVLENRRWYCFPASLFQEELAYNNIYYSSHKGRGLISGECGSIRLLLEYNLIQSFDIISFANVRSLSIDPPTDLIFAFVEVVEVSNSSCSMFML